MDEQTTQLVRQTRQLVSVFRSYGINEWAEWLDRDADLIEAGNLEAGIEHLLSAYGGMGSMSDVFISRQAGDSIDDKDTSRVNSEVRALRSSIYELAITIKARKE